MNTKSSINNNQRCDICKLDFINNAEYALHEFSKKHCDNLIRLAKHKPVVTKEKTKPEPQKHKKETPKVNTVTHTGSFAKYGYFVPGEIYTTGNISKEFNTDYDPYLQKFAEDPCKEKVVSSNTGNNTQPSTGNSTNVSFSRNKKKKIKTCQICNVTLATVPEYEAHMKSPQHIWKLKATGIGVSAHFVRGSSDLHTTDVNEDSKPKSSIEEEEQPNSNVSTENSSPNPFPLLYCNDCELLLNSPQQYNAHLLGKSHIECSQKKAEIKAKKEKLLNPEPNQLYCYSCQISLNNLFQYNEHKNGKKHKTKCKQLIKSGITIPPEERVSGLNYMKSSLNKPVVYPELYEKYVLDKAKQTNLNNNDFRSEASSVYDNTQTVQKTADIISGVYHCEICNEKFGTLVKFNYHINRMGHKQTGSETSCFVNESAKANFHISGEESKEGNTDQIPNKKPSIIFHSKMHDPVKKTESSLKDEELGLSAINSAISIVSNDSENNSDTVSKSEKHADDDFEEKKIENQPDQHMVILKDGEPIKCSICDQDFQWQLQFDQHITKENHLKKIIDLKMKGTSDTDILNTIFSDRSFVKPDTLGRLSCSFCSINTENSKEFEQHLKSIVHKYTLKEYRRKKTIEVRFISEINTDGLYFCKTCNEGWTSLIDFTQHLHLLKHRNIQSAERARKMMAKRRELNIRKQRVMHNLKGKYYTGWKVKFEKNPGVRTKISGVATDLNTGAQAQVPNLEPLEPKIDTTKNVNIGLQENLDQNKVGKVKKLKFNRLRNSNSGKRLEVSQNNLRPTKIPPLIPSSTHPSSQYQVPPLFVRNPQPPFMPHRHWSPYPRPYSFQTGQYFNRSMAVNPPYEHHWFSRTPSPRYGYR